MTIEEFVYAQAAVYAEKKSELAQDLKKDDVNLSDLPLNRQFFWTAVFFNFGNADGQAKINRYGEGYLGPLPGANNDNPHPLNAVVRTNEGASLNLYLHYVYRDPVETIPATVESETLQPRE
jgi:hypothetical protein